MPQIRALVPSPPFYLMTGLAAVAIVFLAMWPKAKPPTPFDSRCESWDMEAANALANLIGNRSEIADAYLGDALFRLRRARKYCRYGFVSLARLDYEVLLGNRYGIGQ